MGGGGVPVRGATSCAGEARLIWVGVGGWWGFLCHYHRYILYLNIIIHSV